MTKAADKTTKKEDIGTPARYFEFAAYNGDLIGTYMQASQVLFESAWTWNQEVMRFADERFQANAQVLQALPKCANWMDTVNVQSDFVRSATDAYAAEMSKLTEQAARTATTIWAPMIESAKALPEAVAKT